MKNNVKYYSLKNIKAKNARYNIIFSERSNGKTYAVLYEIINNYAINKKQSAYIRRWKEDFVGKRGANLFANLVNDNIVSKLTGGEWTDIFYYSSAWYFCKYDDEKKRICDREPFCFGFSISSMEHDKSTGFPNVTIIFFDEFISRGFYIQNEFVEFMNILSTIIRLRDDVIIYMCGNTSSQYCPYFSEFGLTHIKQMQKGNIDVYTYGESGLVVAVEFAEFVSSKKSNVYFAFDNPRLNMITGNGNVWEMDIYPHLTSPYTSKDILFTYFIVFNGETMQCEIINTDNSYFTFIHMKTTPIKYPDSDIIFNLEYNMKPNYRRKINKPYDKIGKKIYWFFAADKITYQDNETGERVREYLQACGS